MGAREQHHFPFIPSSFALQTVSKMNSKQEKMHDEMLENETRKGSGTLEAGFAEEDGKAMRSVVFKMDVRYTQVLWTEMSNS